MLVPEIAVARAWIIGGGVIDVGQLGGHHLDRRLAGRRVHGGCLVARKTAFSAQEPTGLDKP